MQAWLLLYLQEVEGRTVGSRNMSPELTNMESTVNLLVTFKGLKPVRRHDEIAKKTRASWLKR